ncbi:MAG TPA: helix-turn-helix domain-containing protein, partial [Ramlibacter sp.]
KSGRPMKQVSIESGYGSSSAFTRAFIRQVGLAPSQWLRKIEAASADVDPHGAAEAEQNGSSSPVS